MKAVHSRGWKRLNAERYVCGATGSHESGTAVDPGSEAVERRDSAAKKPDPAAAEDHDSDGAASRDSCPTQRWDRHVSERRDTESLNVAR